ncbi:hypothetical protein [Magnetofaba australis]|uniref:hypothetical protein n=1 Tax=Magnetofaba australis TaxID=1472297 RepID=UPI000A19D457|nr:hypothetical protein [Magnetofaba australis]
MDRRTLLAIVLSVLLLVGFQFYMAWKYPPKKTAATPPQSQVTTAADVASAQPAATPVAPVASNVAPVPTEGMSGDAQTPPPIPGEAMPQDASRQAGDLYHRCRPGRRASATARGW